MIGKFMFCTISPYSREIPFDQIYRLTSHNSYSRSIARSLTEVLSTTHSIEIDIWDDRNAIFSIGAEHSRWFVRHSLSGGNDSNATTPGDFTACLNDIAAYMNANPNHPIITCFIEKKQGWGETRNPEDFDNLIVSIIGRAKLYCPTDLKSLFPSLRSSTSTNWPIESALSGKAIFVIHGGRWHGIRDNEVLCEYVSDRRESAVAFVAPRAEKSSHITGIPEGFNHSSAEWVVFYNLASNFRQLSSIVRSNGYISRVWGAAKDNESYTSLVRCCANFIGVDDFRQNSWNNGMLQGKLTCVPK